MDIGYRFWAAICLSSVLCQLSLLKGALSLYSVSCTSLTKVLLQYYNSGLQPFWPWLIRSNKELCVNHHVHSWVPQVEPLMEWVTWFCLVLFHLFWSRFSIWLGGISALIYACSLSPTWNCEDLTQKWFTVPLEGSDFPAKAPENLAGPNLGPGRRQAPGPTGGIWKHTTTELNPICFPVFFFKRYGKRSIRIHE